ncbi:unnamed protein product [Adineta ricciae]|uniref:Protein kinase domain-containing protein n=1 Tax=Adineta ricciae TaxID=249248 RepID=A0A814VRT6_ADIRI|nr:unnamed protein product [Adineta ricciae]
MEKSTSDKSIQTDPVIILPISDYLTKSHCVQPLESQLSSILSEDESYGINVYYINVHSSYDSGKRESVDGNNSSAIDDGEGYERVSVNSGKLLTLLSPIYVLKRSRDTADHDGCEVGDEFEFISEVPTNSTMLRLKHLRTARVLDVDRSHVELDINTPLRLGNSDRGVIECFLLKCVTRYSFLIYRSDQDENVYILSANQHHITKEALISHYSIRINKQNNCFYLEQERNLRHCFFKTFQQLVNSPKVLQFIRLSNPVDRHLSMNEDELWQIDFNHLTIGHKIGSGAFGEVLGGRWERNGLFETIDVAIKRLKLNNVVSDEFASEIRAMKRLRNKYLVSLLGIAVDPVTNEKLMITEFMVDGDLKKWLEHQTALPPDEILANFCHQICLGMSCLERNKFVHRDLACRNILLRGDRAKIADFGMARINEEDTYYRVEMSQTSVGKVPYRWTAPEIFAGEAYTSRSDVWSLGICLVEIWSKASTPYPTLTHAADVVTKVRAGYVHEKPKQCSEKYYSIIKTCLVLDPHNRPTFKLLSEWFKNLLIDKDANTIPLGVKPSKNGNESFRCNSDVAAPDKKNETNPTKTNSTEEDDPYPYIYATTTAPNASKMSMNSTSTPKVTPVEHAFKTVSAVNFSKFYVPLPDNPAKSSTLPTPKSATQDSKSSNQNLIDINDRHADSPTPF